MNQQVNNASTDPGRNPISLDRRTLLRQAALVLAGGHIADCATDRLLAADPEAKAEVRIGLLTDIHYADRKAAGTRYYRESLGKLREAVALFNQAKLELAIELGDLIDAADDLETEIGYLKTIEAEYAKFKGKRHYVFGNHCLAMLTKKEFLEHSGATDPFYSFDSGGWHFVILDACYRADGKDYGRNNFTWTDTNIPLSQRKWLAADLKATDKKTIVFVHQRLDVKGPHGIKQAPQVRQILEESKKVVSVFTGHSHQNSHQQIGGIHYCVVRAVVEGSGEKNSGYAAVDLFADGSLRIDGFREQKDYDW